MEDMKKKAKVMPYTGGATTDMKKKAKTLPYKIGSATVEALSAPSRLAKKMATANPKTVASNKSVKAAAGSNMGMIADAKMNAVAQKVAMNRDKIKKAAK